MGCLLSFHWLILEGKAVQIRLGILLAVVLLFVPFAVSAQETDDPKLTEYVVTADTANLRLGPGTNFGVAGTAVKGETLLMYDEVLEASGWLRIYRSGEDDAYIADFLVEEAPVRFYPVDQEPVAMASGRGKGITDIYDLPAGAYRIDVVVEDNSFILKSVTVAGQCRDRSIFNEFNSDVSQLNISGLLISQGCSLIFETDNVTGNWQFEIRDILAPEALVDSKVIIDETTSVSGVGRALTMATELPEGLWTVSATVDDRAFILAARVAVGECDDGTVFNELDFDANTLEISTLYRSGEDGCIIFWETDNVEGPWELAFERIR